MNMDVNHSGLTWCRATSNKRIVAVKNSLVDCYLVEGDSAVLLEDIFANLLSLWEKLCSISVVTLFHSFVITLNHRILSSIDNYYFSNFGNVFTHLNSSIMSFFSTHILKDSSLISVSFPLKIIFLYSSFFSCHVCNRVSRHLTYIDLVYYTS